MTATATETEHLVRAVNVTKAFGSNEVLKGIDLTVDAKEVVCLLGPSGSGKTTFLRLINQMESLLEAGSGSGASSSGSRSARANFTCARIRTLHVSVRGSAWSSSASTSSRI